MRFVISLAVAGVLALIAWPTVDVPDAPALMLVGAREPGWTAQRVAWVGDDAKRNAILMSAVWNTGNDVRR